MTDSLAGFERMSINEGAQSLHASTLDVSTHELVLPASLELGSGQVGEEMGAVLHGEFDVDAAGEHYRLSAGQVIVIPAGEPRRYQVVSEKGTLYRVVVAMPRVEGEGHG